MRYFFHIWSQRGETLRDHVGVSLSGAEAVASEAGAQARRFADEVATGGPDYAGCWFEVADADRRRFFTIPAFGAVARPRRWPYTATRASPGSCPRPPRVR